MLFRSRRPETLAERIRLWLLPRRSYSRSWRYLVRRLLRLSAAPNVVALGLACGVFSAFTPFVGLHLLLAALLAWLVGGNVIASAVGSHLGNPLTFPVIWAATYETGTFILKGRAADAPETIGRLVTEHSWGDILHLIGPMTVGAVPLGLIAAAAVFFPTRRAVAAYHDRRRERLGERRLVGQGSASVEGAGGAREG